MFLFIFEDGTIKKSLSGPTQEDIDCIEDGILEVLLCEGNDVHRLNSRGEREEIESTEEGDGYHS